MSESDTDPIKKLLTPELQAEGVAYAQAIGFFAINYAAIDLNLATLLRILLKIEDQTSQNILSAALPFRTKLTLVRELAEHHHKDLDLNPLNGALRRAAKLSNKRNQLMHGGSGLRIELDDQGIPVSLTPVLSGASLPPQGYEPYEPLTGPAIRKLADEASAIADILQKQTSFLDPGWAAKYDPATIKLIEETRAAAAKTQRV
ncbi:MAG: hypothetical protein F8N37_17840 [Telmatospirillum sp.]|nr:hypothetical protein [Telmatospirillum sp.]